MKSSRPLLLLLLLLHLSYDNILSILSAHRHVWQLSEVGGDAITALQWNPNPAHQLIAAAVGNVIVLIATGTGQSLYFFVF